MKRTALGFLAIWSIPTFFSDVYADSTIGVLPLTEGYTQEAPKIDAGGAIQIKPAGEIPMPTAINSDPGLVPAPSTEASKNINVIGPAPSWGLPLFMKPGTVITPGRLPLDIQKKIASQQVKKSNQSGNRP